MCVPDVIHRRCRTLIVLIPEAVCCTSLNTAEKQENSKLAAIIECECLCSAPPPHPHLLSRNFQGTRLAVYCVAQSRPARPLAAPRSPVALLPPTQSRAGRGGAGRGGAGARGLGELLDHRYRYRVRAAQLSSPRRRRHHPHVFILFIFL